MPLFNPTAAAKIALLTATQTTNSQTYIPITGHTFEIPAGMTLILIGKMLFTTALTSNGAGYGIRVTQPAGADGAAIGAWEGEVGVTAAAAATALRDADVFNVVGGSNTIGSVLGTASTAGNNAASCSAIIKNTATNATTTVTIETRSETLLNDIILQIGTVCSGVLANG